MIRTYFILFLLTFSLNSFACKCKLNNLKTEIENADFIFKGQVIKKIEKQGNIDYYFISKKIWKGVKSDTIKVTTGFAKTDCGQNFEINDSYIVFASNGHTSRCRKNSKVGKNNIEPKLDLKLNKDFETAFKNKSYLLTPEEAEYLNQHFSKNIDFDFKEKRILFTYNHSITTKPEWITTNWEYERPSVQIVELTNDEKNEFEIDAILITWSKILIQDKQKKRILKQLK